MIKASSSFNPIRLIEGEETPTVMTIYIKNNFEESKIVSLLVKIPFSLGFNKMGLERETRRRLGFLKPGEEKAVPIMIYPKKTIKEGVYPIETKIMTHKDNYTKTDKIYILNTELRVIKK